MADGRNKTYETSEIRVRVFWEQSESFHTQASLSMLKSSVSSEGHAILSTGRQVCRKVVRGSPCNCGLHSEVEGYNPGTSNAILLATTSNSLLLQVTQTLEKSGRMPSWHEGAILTFAGGSDRNQDIHVTTLWRSVEI